MRYLDNMNLNVFLLHVRDSFGYGITKQFDFGKAVDVGTWIINFWIDDNFDFFVDVIILL